MPYYAQLNDFGVCFAVSHLASEVIQDNLIPIGSLDEKYLSKKYDKATGRFYGLRATVDRPTIRVGEIALVLVEWADLDGNLVNESESIEAISDGARCSVAMMDGRGSFEFSSDVPGNFVVEIRSASGCWASAEVTVVG